MNILSHLKLFRKRYLIALFALIFAGTVYVSADILLSKYKNPDGLSKQDILTMVGENKPNRENCQIIFDTDLTQYHDELGNIRKSVYDYQQTCDQMFNIAYADLNLDFCTRVIAGSQKDFLHRYLKLQDFPQIQTSCIEKYLTVSFATGSLFDPENGFKSTVKVNFGLPFYEDLDDPNSPEFLEHRIAAKKRLIELLEISPKTDITVDDVVLYSQQAQISLHLEPETSYTFKMKEYASKLEGESMKSTPFTLNAPKFQYFGLRTTQKITLLPDTMPQTMELLSYDSGKTSAEIKICRIANEQYAKIEVLENTKGLKKEKDAFFTKGIDAMESFDCKTKTITFSETDKLGAHIARKSFDFAAEIGNPARSGLYYVTFAREPERTNFGKVQTPLFFGMIDSHITMKISKNGEAFFFVNDFKGKPLSGQKIRVYSNEFQEKETQYNYENGNYSEKATYFSPLDKNVFVSGSLLGETDANGILKVQLKDKVAAHFQKTLDSWDYGSNGKWDSFFVTASSDTNLSYVSSKWNGGITPWNFGYSLNSGWWYGEENLDEITLDAWSDTESKFYTHTFTDRKLYLPGEEVFIKSIFRTSADLKTPSGELFTLKIQNPAGEEILKKEVSVSDFGSINTSYMLSQDAKLGAYNLSLSQGDSVFAFTNFNVEVFQKPKFKNEVMLQVQGLSGELVSIKETKKEITQWGYEREIYTGDFQIDAVFDTQYYSGLPVAGANYSYKVYKQPYYDTSYWDDCYYGCYWEAEKEFYTEGTGSLDAQGKSQISLPIAFESEYDDFKYIVELTVTDTAGDVISGSNSIIARLPAKYKTWNPNSGISFTSEKRFYKAGEKLELVGKMDIGKFSKDYENQFALIIKKKDYFTKYVQDVRGYKRPVTTTKETIQDVRILNEKNFKIHSDGTISLDYTLKDTGEYIFEYGRINPALFKIPNGKDGQTQAGEIIASFAKEKLDKVSLGVQNISYFKDDYQTLDFLQNTCVGGAEKCDYSLISQKIACLSDAPKTQKIYSDEVKLQEKCQSIEKTFPVEMTVGIEDILDASGRRYFTLVSHGDQAAQNPVQSDNKITVLSEKISYKLGEKARVLVRLPFSGGKILWTLEKQGVIKSEYIDVPGNIFFKEIEITDDFLPNAYIGVVAINPSSLCPSDISLHEGDQNCIPEYKVGYSEIVVDKTDKKSDITIQSNKETYKPREKVTLDISVQNPLKTQDISELTVMVVDDSLISLMGNVDLNILEKIYRKLPFQIQTSLTNIAMLRNYYFSRQGIVGGSGMGNNKGGDSAISSRNIFKNTAYYNGTLKTDANGKARAEFTLPDNLTNFRVMVVSQSKANIFGYAEEMIEVRKDIFVEDRSPLILRSGDKVEIGANIFNSTEESVDLSVSFNIGTDLGKTPVKKVSLATGASSFVSWDFTNIEECKSVRCTLPYSITVTGKNADLSDTIEGNMSIVQDPIILQNTLSSQNIEAGTQKDLSLKLPENIDIQKSRYTLTLSNNPFVGIEDTYKTLLQYPYGCVEQLLSSTLPNAILKRFTKLSEDIEVKPTDLENNLSLGLAKILKLQNTDGGFKYWENDPISDKAMTPHVLRTLLEMRDAGVALDERILQNAANYLKNNINVEQPTYLRLEALWAYSRYYTGQKDKIAGAFGFPNIATAYKAESLTSHDLLSYTYALYYTDKELYKAQIEKNISLLKQLKKTDSDYEYYSPTEDIAHLAILEMKLGKTQAEVTPAIVVLYQKNWKSYWYSTKERNAAFLAFVAYMEKYGTQYENTLEMLFASGAEIKNLSSEEAVVRLQKTLSSVLKDQEALLTLKNTSGNATIFATADIEVRPLNPLKVKPYTNGMQVTREIYKVIDDTKLEEECVWDEARGYYCIPAAGLKLFTGNTFKKGAMYQIRLKANFSDREQRNNLTLEDHLPAGFTILNSRFQTNSIATSQASSDTWAWNYVNLRPETVMANARYSWGNEAEYKYFIRADFAGEYLYPSLAGYLMYEPTVRANTEFRRIVVK